MADKKEPAAVDVLEALLRLDAATLDDRIASQKAVIAAEEGKLRQLTLLRKSVAFRNGEVKRYVRKPKKSDALGSDHADRAEDPAPKGNASPSPTSLLERLRVRLAGRDYIKVCLIAQAWNKTVTELLAVIRENPRFFIVSQLNGQPAVKLAE